MPVIVRPLTETTQCITRPVIQGALELVKKYTGIEIAVPVQLYTQANQAPLPGTAMNGPTRNSIQFDAHEKIKADYTEQFEEQDILSTNVNWTDNVPVFLDEPLQIIIRPIRTQVNVELQIQYRLPDEAAAQRFIADLRLRMGMERSELPLELKYTYPIPDDYLTRIAHFHELRERVAPYGQSFVDYLRQCFDHRTTVERTHGNKAHRFSVNEVQGGILGNFDFKTPPRAERNSDNGSWLASFTFAFTYEKPIAVILNHPISIHNQMIAPAYLPRGTPYSFTARRLMDLTRTAYERLPYTRPRPPQHPIGGFVVPSYDDWNPTTRFDRATTSVFTTLLFVDESDPYQICDMTALGHWEIQPIWLDWIRKNPQHVFKASESPVVFEVYTGNTRWAVDSLYFDEQLNLRSVSPLDVRKVHHLRVALVTDLTALTEAYAANLRASGHTARAALLAVDDTLEKRGFLPRLRGGKLVAPLDWYAALKAIDTTDAVWRTRPEYRRNTVGQFIRYTGDPHAYL